LETALPLWVIAPSKKSDGLRNNTLTSFSPSRK